MEEGVAACDIEDGREHLTAGTRVQAIQAYAGGLPPDAPAKSTGLQGASRSIPEEESTGAMYFGEVEFCDGVVDRPEGWFHHPTEASLSFLPNLGPKTVVGATQRHLQLDVIGHVGQKECCPQNPLDMIGRNAAISRSCAANQPDQACSEQPRRGSPLIAAATGAMAWWSGPGK